MIAIVSSAARERAAFVALCEIRRWPSVDCDSVRAFESVVRRQHPTVVVLRHQLVDGYSDDVIALLGRHALTPGTKVIVLLSAGTPSRLEARQIALGADCVQHDPVRTEVLAAYLAKYVQREIRPRRNVTPADPAALPFAGGSLHVADRKLQHAARSAVLTRREVQLAELLAQCAGSVVTYETLYSEILGRRFGGDTSNMRVLLGKLATSTSRIGITLRDWVRVIPKSGYCYGHPPPSPASRTAADRAARR